MEHRDIHKGVSLEDSFAYREHCQQNYWDAMDHVECARIALAAINNHIQNITQKEQQNGIGIVEITPLAS
jgi:hypothetical protein